VNQWTKNEIETLTRLHKEGQSTVQIARVLHTKTLTQIRKFILHNRYELGLEYRFPTERDPAPDPAGSFHNQACHKLITRRWHTGDSK